MGSTSTPTPNNVSTDAVQNLVLGDQHVYGNQNFNPRADDTQAPVQDCLRSLAFPEMNDRSNAIDISTGGTCKWLLRHKTWKDWKSSQRGLLWIKGKPGSGKSTLLRYALRELNSAKVAKNALVLSFFFHGRGNDLQRNQVGLFRSLLHQALSKMPEELDKVVATFEQRRDGIGRVGEDWTWELDELRQLFKWSVLDILMRRPVWIFVDALDESGVDNAKDVMRHFRDLIQGPSASSQLHICFACRHYPVQSWEGAREICTEHENRQDIITYARTRLSNFPNPTTLNLPNLITNRSNGLFIWARLVVDRILDLQLVDNHDSAHQLIMEIIDKIPQDLDALYAEITREMENATASLKLIQWVSCARRPLSLDELRWAMVIDPDSSQTSLRDYKQSPDYIESNDVMEGRVKKMSHGLVEVISSSETRTVQFIHQSVKDFFDNRPPESLEEASWDRSLSVTEVAHYKLYRTCIHYLAMEEIEHLPNGTKMSFKQLMELDRASLLSGYPLLKYAGTYWTLHLERSHNRYREGFQSWPPKNIVDRWINVSWLIDEFVFWHAPSMVTLVHILARAGSDVALQMFLRQGKLVDINERDVFGRTPLLYASERGILATVQVLLAEGAEVDCTDLYGAAPLHFAAHRGSVSVMSLLLAGGADADLRDDKNRTPLAWAIEGKQEAAIKMLLERPVDVNHEYVCMTPFLFVRAPGRILTQGTTFFVFDPWMPLKFCTPSDLGKYDSLLSQIGKSSALGWKFRFSRVGTWMRSTSKISRQLPYAAFSDRTPLLRAVELGLKSVVEMLLDKEADSRKTCRTGWSPLLLAQLRHNSSDKAIMGLLEAYPRDPTVSLAEGRCHEGRRAVSGGTHRDPREG